jgi:catechol 2,3-dioxygenase-like lactoylglutathione lyase family enzyme
MAERLRPIGILHFAIGVTDLDAARTFYEDVLGCTYLRRNDTTVFMQVGSQYFVLTNTKHHRSPNPPGEYEFHHAFIVAGEDFDAALRTVAEQGYPVIVYEEEGHRTFTGRHAYIHDPFGNAIEIIDFHGIGDFSRPDFQGRRRRQAKKAPGKSAASSTTKGAAAKPGAAKKRRAGKAAAKKPSKKPVRKPVLKTTARPKAAARRPSRRPPRPTRRR